MRFYGSESRPAKAQNAPAAARLRSLRKVVRRPALSLVSDLHPGSALKFRLGVGLLAVGRIHEREDRYVSGSPAVHGLVTNLALGIAPLLERKTSRRHLIFGAAIGTFEDDHRSYYAPTRDDVESPSYGLSRQTAFLPLGKSILDKASERSRPAWMLELADCLGLDLSNPLARHRKLLAYFLQRVVAIHTETKAHTYNSLLAWR